MNIHLWMDINIRKYSSTFISIRGIAVDFSIEG